MAKRNNQQSITKITDDTEYDFFYSENKEDFTESEPKEAPNGEKYNIRLCVENRNSSVYKDVVKKYGDLKKVYEGKIIYEEQ